MKVRPHLVPLPSKSSCPYGTSYPRLRSSGSTLEIVCLQKSGRSSYARHLFSKYHVEYGIRTARGKVFDQDEALLLGVKSTVESLGKVDLFMEVGAGTGSASAVAMESANVCKVIANDISEDVRRHLEYYLGSLAKAKGTHLTVSIADCSIMKYPSGTSVLAVSTVFGSQPTLLSKKGPEIRKALGSEGVLLSASSMTDMLFYHYLINGGEPRLRVWPWYARTRPLHTLFNHVRALKVGNQVLSLASQSERTIGHVSDRMKEEGADDFHVELPSILKSSSD